MSLIDKIFGTHSEHELKHIYPIVDKIESIRKALSLPSNIVPYAVLALGKPEDQGEPMWKKDEIEEKIHWEKW